MGSYKINAGRRMKGVRGGASVRKEGRIAPNAAYQAGDSYLFSVGSKQLAQMGTDDAIKELARRARLPDGTKTAWAKKNPAISHTHMLLGAAAAFLIYRHYRGQGSSALTNG
jgi:hypothetical protein